MRGAKLGAIASRAKIIDSRHTVKLDTLKDKWSKSKPLNVIEPKEPKQDKSKPLSKRQMKKLQQIEKQERLDDLQKSLDFLNKKSGKRILSFEQVEKRKQKLRKAKRIDLSI